ncbi:MAG: peptidoglycan -binding protein [Rhodobacteraceae bacterium]|nr:peptidoglycan -binding protein [Paracoccaceae bacterium]
MALQRRSGSRFSANIWPGFVDAMTALLLVLMFVLTIFMIVQFVLRETITGQDEELNELSVEILGLASALGLERSKSAALEDNVSTLNSTLDAREQEAQERQSLIDALTIQSDNQAEKITTFQLKLSSFEAQVAGLLTQNSDLSSELGSQRSKIAVLTGESAALRARNQRLAANMAERTSRNAALQAQNKTLSGDLADQQAQNQRLVADVEGRANANAELAAQNQRLAADAEGLADTNAKLAEENQLLLADKDALERANLQVISQSEALQLALVRAREEMDESVEAARLAAVKREVMESVISDLQQEVSSGEGSLSNALAALAASETELGTTRNELTTSLAELASSQENAAGLQGNLAQMQSDLANSRDALALSQKDLAAAQGGLSSTGDHLEKTRDELAATLSELAKARGSLAATRTELAGTRDKLQDSQADVAAQGLSEAALRERIAKLAEGMSDEKKARLAEAVAAAALQARLKNAQDELTAMTLSLEAQRKAAEDTLTLLAAAELAERDALGRVQVELTDRQKKAALLATANSRLAEEKALSAEGRRKVTLLNQQTVELRKQLDVLQGLLDQSAARDTASKVQIEALGSNLNTALAQVAAEQKKVAKEQTKLAEEQLARANLEEKERIRLQAEAKDLKKFRSEFFGRLREVLGAQEGIRIVGDRFVFSSEILFGAGSADLGQGGKDEIRKVANIILDVADQIPEGIDWVLRVDGHTDKTPVSGFGLYGDNWALSQARALSVVKYLIDDLGIPANRLAANGFGEFQPIAQGDSPEALAQNRRIELKFTEK